MKGSCQGIHRASTSLDAQFDSGQLSCDYVLRSVVEAVIEQFRTKSTAVTTIQSISHLDVRQV